MVDAEKMMVFTAPSGSGKTTIVRHLLEKFEQLEFSISATTRSKRDHETDGKDYYFLTVEAFKEKIDQEAFVEWEEVYPGRFYGTLKSEVERIWNEGKFVLFDVDVLGAGSIKKMYGEKCMAVFVKPPSIEILAERLKARKTETPETLEIRKARFLKELQHESNFDVVLINDQLVDALADAETLVRNFFKLN
ncbi:MAG TPA: guanylate kinase [Saprospirales bacterium]|nr:guanylate kinase [Saprospirales bacterium]HAY71931.1 guanylate kinase [Saprospirales bacterium]HRQ28436.1 guanylate kinase [Saprospiraceae bacterium]